MTLTTQEAHRLVERVRVEAQQLGKALSVAVVDYGGFPVVVERLQGARPMTPTIALAKAYTAAVMQRPTQLLEPWAQSDPVFFAQVGRMGQYPVVATKGGFTLTRDGVVLGGIGISGASPEEDQRVVEAVVAAEGYELQFAAWAAPSGGRRGR